MGITAENVARKHSISREAQDALAIESHKRAARAQAEGRFTSQILPIEVKTRKGTTVFDTDEHVRADASLDEMTKLRPAFDKEGSVTARSEEHTSELQSLMRISYAVFCLKKKKPNNKTNK